MKEVERLSNELASAFRDSEEYKNYLEAYHELMKHPSLMRETNEMRRNNLHIQNSNSVDSVGMFDRVGEFSRQYAALRCNKVVEDFLQAELCLCRLIQDSMKLAVSKIDFDTSFLEH
jgi:cell fate (sporulation/competence/biofilm development) regulator YlbF (YheA/YmcA/DUF963 family)